MLDIFRPIQKRSCINTSSDRRDVYKAGCYLINKFDGVDNLRHRSETNKLVRVWAMLFSSLLVFILQLSISACSTPQDTELDGKEHLECTSNVRFVTHNTVCQADSRNKWIDCEITGVVQNIGDGEAADVLVTLEYGQQVNGVRNSAFNVLGDIEPGEKSRFENEFFHYEPFSQYDITISCSEYISANPTSAPPPRFSFVSNGPRDAFSFAIDYSDPTTMYAGTQSRGLFKSEDGGQSWTPQNSGMANVKIGAIAIDPSEPTRIYAGTYGTDGYNGAIYRSTDGGESWLDISNGMDGAYVVALAVNPVSPSIVYAGTSKGIFRTMNGGEVWEILDVGLAASYVSHLAIDPVTPSNIYAVSTGDSWRGILKSINGGDDWSSIETEFTNTSISELAIDPQMPSILYAGTQGQGIFKSTDAGESWTAVNTGLGNYPRIMSLVIDPIAPSILFAAVRDVDIFKSTDGGESWSALDTNLADTFVWTLMLNPNNPTIVYIVSESGVSILGE